VWHKTVVRTHDWEISNSRTCGPVSVRNSMNAPEMEAVASRQFPHQLRQNAPKYAFSKGKFHFFFLGRGIAPYLTPDW